MVRFKEPALQWCRSAMRSGFMKSIVTLMSANVIGAVVLLIATPILTRLYEPADFGLIAPFSAAMSILMVASSLRYEVAIPLPKSDKSARLLLVFALVLNAIAAIVLALLIALWGPAVLLRLGVPEIAPLLIFLPIMVLGAGTYRCFRLWAIRMRDFRSIGRTKIVQSFGQAVVQIAMGAAGFGPSGLIVGQIVGFSSGTMRLARGSISDLRQLLKSGTIRRIRVLARRFIKFPAFDTPASIINTMAVQLPNLLLIVLFGPAVAGAYALVERVLTAPMSMFGQTVGQVLFSVGRDAATRGRLGQAITMTALGTLAIAAIPTLVIVLFGVPLFEIFFGPQWSQAGIFASWLMPGLALQMAYTAVSTSLLVADGQKLGLYIHSATLVLKTGAILFGFVVDQALMSIIGLGAVSLIGNATAILLAVRHARRRPADTQRLSKEIE
jgi:O-antigen/teichoic acid export membrane protein